MCFHLYSNHLYLAVKGETGTSIQARPFHSTSVADLSYLAIVKKWKQSAFPLATALYIALVINVMSPARL